MDWLEWPTRCATRWLSACIGSWTTVVPPRAQAGRDRGVLASCVGRVLGGVLLAIRMAPSDQRRVCAV